MLKTIFKWIGIGLGGLGGLLLLAIAVVYLMTNARLNKSYNLQVETVAIPSGVEAIERGKHVATIRACLDCHGEDLAGKVYLEDPALGRIVASNLTRGKNGAGSSYSDEDYVRAIRHGVGRDHKALLFMPSQEFYYLSDADLGALIAFIKSAPPVDSNLPASQLALPLRAISLFNRELAILSAELIDHEAPRPAEPEVSVTAAYGEHLAVTCTGCHGADLSGGPITGAPPDFPPAMNLTPAGELSGWSDADFINTLRTGITPSGYQLKNDYMPWKVFGQMTDDELKALFLYLQSLPAKEQVSR